MSWHERAACRGLPIDVFYPGCGKGPKSNQRALACCRVCPVRSDCLENALAEEIGLPLTHRVGVRGGLNPERRHRLAKEREAWEELERSWRAWRLERDRIELHREEWAVPV